MKKIILVLAAALFSAGVMSAQDLGQATETYNSGATALADGDKAAALEFFQQALKEGEAVGDEAAELVNNCKTTIPKLILSIAKDNIKAKDFAAAVENLTKAIKTGNDYEQDEVSIEAEGLVPQVYMQQGNAAMTAKKYDEAETAYNKVLELDATNGAAALRLGAVLNSAGKTEEAIAAFEKAAELGQAKDANKQLSNIYVKEAQTALKANKNAEAFELAAKSNAALENSNAYKLAASAAQKLGKDTDMIAAYEKYLELTPNAKDAAGVNFTIAATYQKAGNKEKAKEFYSKVPVTDAQFGASAKQQLDALNK